MLLNSDWLISVQLIPNSSSTIRNSSEKLCNTLLVLLNGRVKSSGARLNTKSRQGQESVEMNLKMCSQPKASTTLKSRVHEINLISISICVGQLARNQTNIIEHLSKHRQTLDEKLCYVTVLSFESFE